MTQRTVSGVTWNLTYNAENRTQSIANADGSYGVTYLYDGDGVRVGQATSTTATYYFAGGAYEVTVAVPANTETGVKKYYSLGGQMVAMDDGSGLNYFLQDHLGSLVAVLNADGNIIPGSEQRYLPFGEVRGSKGNITQTDFGYTGQRDLDGTGLMDYRARFCDSSLGRFIQPDTIIPDMSNPQAWNRYAYVFNRPVTLTDPSGHIPCQGGAIILDDQIICMGTGGNNGGGNSGGGGGSGGGGKPIKKETNGDDQLPSDDEAACDAMYCITDMTPSHMRSYWEYNNDVFGGMSFIGGLSAFNAVASIYIYPHIPKIVTAASVALAVGAINPEPLSKAAMVIFGLSAIALAYAVVASSDMQSVNNSIASTNALSEGGSLSVNPFSVTVTSAGGQSETTVTYSGFVQLVTYFWSGKNLPGEWKK